MCDSTGRYATPSPHGLFRNPAESPRRAEQANLSPKVQPRKAIYSAYGIGDRVAHALDLYSRSVTFAARGRRARSAYLIWAATWIARVTVVTRARTAVRLAAGGNKPGLV